VPEIVQLPASTLLDLRAYEVRPLDVLTPEIAEFLATRQGRATVGVVVRSEHAIYTHNPELAMPMSSVSKLVIMLAVMERAQQRNMPLTEEEQALLRPMITVSDNDSATQFWRDLGGGPAITAFLDRVGLSGIMPNSAEDWGSSRASGPAVATLMAQLAWGDILTPEHRALALELLSQVVPDQRWGVTAGTPVNPPEGSLIGIKDGWYPAPRGWRVASAGILQPAPSAPTASIPYTIAVLTVQQPSLEEAIVTIETVAAAVHDVLHGHR
jgi:hypothetical protein